MARCNIQYYRKKDLKEINEHLQKKLNSIYLKCGKK